MGKYAPLTRFLRERAEPHVTLRFSELEEVLGFSLPESAYKYPAWWANSSSGQSQMKGWLDAGWETRDVDLRGRKVAFVRVAGEPVAAPGAGAAPGRKSGAPAGGARKSRENSRRSIGGAAGLAAAVDMARLALGVRRLLESRAARHGRKAAEEVMAVLAAALEEERAALAEELALMRGRTQRPGAFDLMDVLGRKKG